MQRPDGAHGGGGIAANAARMLGRRSRQHEAGSTPARLQGQLVRIVLAAAVTGVLIAVLASSRHGVTERVTDNVEPVIVAARQVKVDLARADAAAANAFLAGGLENADQRARYVESLEAASGQLEEAARRTGDDNAAHGEIKIMASKVAVYAGLVESARANNRLNLPVGAGYLNAASSLLKSDVYPAADRLTQLSVNRYRDDYNSQVGFGLVFVALVIAAAAVLVLLLVRAQLFVRARFRRTLNPPLLGASVLAAALLVWMAVGFASQLSHLRTARVDGYEGLRTYLDTRAAGFTAKGDESLYLIARGNGAAFEDDFTAQSRYIVSEAGDGSGLLEGALDEASSPAEETAAIRAAAAWTAYHEVHATIVTDDRAGNRDGAVAAATGAANEAFDEFEAASQDGLVANQSEFRTEMGAAARPLRWLAFGGALLAAAGALGAAWGITMRLREYR